MERSPSSVHIVTSEHDLVSKNQLIFRGFVEASNLTKHIRTRE